VLYNLLFLTLLCCDKVRRFHVSSLLLSCHPPRRANSRHEVAPRANLPSLFIRDKYCKLSDMTIPGHADVCLPETGRLEAGLLAGVRPPCSSSMLGPFFSAWCFPRCILFSPTVFHFISALVLVSQRGVCSGSCKPFRSPLRQHFSVNGFQLRFQQSTWRVLMNVVSIGDFPAHANLCD